MLSPDKESYAQYTDAELTIMLARARKEAAAILKELKERQAEQ